MLALNSDAVERILTKISSDEYHQIKGLWLKWHPRATLRLLSDAYKYGIRQSINLHLKTSSFVEEVIWKRDGRNRLPICQYFTILKKESCIYTHPAIWRYSLCRTEVVVWWTLWGVNSEDGSRKCKERRDLDDVPNVDLDTNNHLYQLKWPEMFLDFIF